MKKALNANTIKLIAILAMTGDHIAWIFFPGYTREPLPLILHIIGRITCPIMCYFIAEGYHHTKNVSKYTARLFLFAFISHFAYLFAFADKPGWQTFIPFYSGNILNQTSVMWSLAWGLVLLRISDSTKIKTPLKVLLTILVCIITLPADWSCIAALCVLAIGTNRGNFKAQMLWMVLYVALYTVVYCMAIDPLYSFLQMAVVLSIPILALYNGKRGTLGKGTALAKWAFYIYYPLHLLILGLLSLMR